MISRQLFDAMHRKKSLSQARFSAGEGGNGNEGSLRRSLTAVDLILYGLGSAVGAGIYILAGIGAKLAGPAITLSFLGCGLSCTLTALAYAEFSSLIPASGSAYIYTYVAFGEIYGITIMLFPVETFHNGSNPAEGLRTLAFEALHTLYFGSSHIEIQNDQKT